MCKKINNRLSEIAPAGRRTLRRKIRLPILYLFTQLSTRRYWLGRRKIPWWKLNHQFPPDSHNADERNIGNLARSLESDSSVNSSCPPQHWCSDQWWWWCANAPRGGVLFGRSRALPPTFGKRAISCIIIRPFHTCCACTQDCACSLSFT